MYGRIVVPLDGSDLAEHALPIAAEVAAHVNGALQLVHVHVPVRFPRSEGVMGRRSREALQRLEDRARRHEGVYLDELCRKLVEARGRIRVTSRVLEGPVGPTLLKVPRELGAQLLVMATHGRGPLGRAVVGGTADLLARQCGVPVLLVRPGQERAQLDREVSFRRVVLTLDGSEWAEQAVSCAVNIAQPFSAAVTVLRVIPPNRAAEAESARDYVDGIADRLRADGLETTALVVEHGKPAQAVLEATRDMEADLVVLATRGRAHVPRLMLGSVADRLIRSGPAPVLVCRPKQANPIATLADAARRVQASGGPQPAPRGA